MRGEVESFTPKMNGETRDMRLSGWQQAVELCNSKITQSNPFALSLSKGRPASPGSRKKNGDFDKLSPNGDQEAALAANARSNSVNRCGSLRGFLPASTRWIAATTPAMSRAS